MSHRESPAAPPPRRRWWQRRRKRRVTVPEHLWPLLERTARLHRTTPEQWVVHVAAQVASAQLLGRLPPRPGPAQHPQQWRQAMVLLDRAAEVHRQAVDDGWVEDVDGRFSQEPPVRGRQGR